jgi:hypothetical protein
MQCFPLFEKGYDSLGIVEYTKISNYIKTREFQLQLSWNDQFIYFSVWYDAKGVQSMGSL